jgi:hypothetical protein
MQIFSKLLRNLSLAAGLGLAAMSFDPAGAQTADSLLSFTSPANVPKLSATNASGAFLHILPTNALRARIDAARGVTAGAAGPTGNLTYHGGKIMPSAILYSIFWTPSSLQDGTPVALTSQYKVAAATLAVDYPGHGIANNSTQYYENDNGVLNFVGSAGANGGQYTDTSAYPSGGCSYTFGTIVTNSANCFSDAQLQAEIAKVMSIKGWTPGINKMFLVYTEKGEGSCYSTPCSATMSNCNEAYACYCAYHSSFGTLAAPVIYGNETYGEPTRCNISGTPSPKGDAALDNLMSYTTHEITEAMTDPFGNAWWDSTTGTGYEIGDICSTYVASSMYGTNTWDSGQANQLWNGHVYEVQTEWDQHTGACVQVGP